MKQSELPVYDMSWNSRIGGCEASVRHMTILGLPQAFPRRVLIRSLWSFLLDYAVLKI